MEPTIHQYLRSNAFDNNNYEMKGIAHSRLCLVYVSTKLGLDFETVAKKHQTETDSIHIATKGLTDHLDTEIGFPLSTDPHYKSLTKKFFDRFVSLSEDALKLEKIKPEKFKTPPELSRKRKPAIRPKDTL